MGSYDALTDPSTWLYSWPDIPYDQSHFAPTIMVAGRVD